jgi:hypothetical protein
MQAAIRSCTRWEDHAPRWEDYVAYVDHVGGGKIMGGGYQVGGG